MENSQEDNLKNALIQLKVSIQEINLIQNDSINQCDELDCIKENIANAILYIEEGLRK